MSEKRLNLSDVHNQSVENATQIALVQQSIRSLEGSVSSLATTVNNYIQNDQLTKRPNWQLWTTVGALVIAMWGGFWMVLTLKINAEIYPLRENIVHVDTMYGTVSKDVLANNDKISTLVTMAQASIDDRSNLNKKLDLLSDRYTTLTANFSSEHAERLAHEIEIETQFDADSQLRNIQFADQQRLNKLLWEHSKGLGAYPSGPFFFPNVSKRENRTNK